MADKYNMLFIDCSIWFEQLFKILIMLILDPLIILKFSLYIMLFPLNSHLRQSVGDPKKERKGLQNPKNQENQKSEYMFSFRIIHNGKSWNPILHYNLTMPCFVILSIPLLNWHFKALFTFPSRPTRPNKPVYAKLILM